MNKGLAMVGGATLGAGLMYLFDPTAGNRRRSLIRDKFVHAAHEVEDFTGSKMRHLRNKSKGMMHEMKDAMTPMESDSSMS
ncbi:MAG: hypothetical protein KY468_04955 [Armatimonadetes bacterium]|nr:hypothetical protein [Armatimonadota bacterium]